MDRRADRRLLRSFYYVSDRKLANFLDQIDDKARRKVLAKLQASFGISLGPVNLSVQSQSADRSMRSRAQAVQVAVVEDHIRQQFPVGDLATGQHWIEGRADMEWAPLQDGQTVLFCGYAGPLLVALGGSVSHLNGRTSSGDRTGSHSYAIRTAVLSGSDPGYLGRDLAAAARMICFTPQPVRFLAQVISRGTLAGDAPQREFLLATPLYVEDAYRADESPDALVQGTVRWFSADCGWGLIGPDGDEDAIVVDASAVSEGGGRDPGGSAPTGSAPTGSGPTGRGPVLAAGQRVEFRVTHGAAGIEAVSVRPLPAGIDEADAGAATVTRGQPLGPADPGRIGRYQVLRRLGEGSMGMVYLARGDDGGLVAIKVIRAEYVQDPVFLRRFQAEAGNAGQVRAPAVARVITAVTEAEHPYLVTEFIDGPTLEEQVERHGPLPLRDTMKVCTQVAAALEAIHKAGIVHRDLAPSNVILSGTGLKVIDFGIAHALGSDVRHTQIGKPVGTPAYMSPEQINEGELTPASDIFSWAALTVFTVTGHPPFGDRDASWPVVWRQISDGDPDLAEVPDQLRDVVTAALHKEPSQRPTAAQLLERLSAAAPPPVRPRRVPRPRLTWHVPRPRLSRRGWRLAAVGAAAAVALILLTVFLSPSSPSRQTSSPSQPNDWPHALSGSAPSGSQPSSGLVASSGTQIATLSDPAGYPVQDVAFSPYGNTIAGSFESSDVSSGHIDFWNAASHRPTGSMTNLGGGNSLAGVAFSPKDANSLAVADQNGVDLLNLKTRQVKTISDQDSEWLIDVAYTPDAGTVAEGNSIGNIYLLDTASRQWATVTFQDPVVYNSRTGSASGDYVLTQVAVSPTGKTLAAADQDGNVYVWNLTGGSPVVLHGADTQSINTVAFSPDGKTLAIGGPGGTRLWDVATRKFAPPLTGPDTSPHAVAFSPNGKTLAAGDGNGNIYLWDLATRQAKAIPCPVTDWGGLVFSPDGETLAAFGFYDTKIYLYSIKYSTS